MFLLLSPKPLPEKFVMKGVVDRFSEEFVETRRKALDKFLKRVADHPVLSFNEHFNVFLSAKVRARVCVCVSVSVLTMAADMRLKKKNKTVFTFYIQKKLQNTERQVRQSKSFRFLCAITLCFHEVYWQ